MTSKFRTLNFRISTRHENLVHRKLATLKDSSGIETLSGGYWAGCQASRACIGRKGIIAQERVIIDGILSVL